MFTIEAITSDRAKPFIVHAHYAKRMPIVVYAFGLFEDGLLVGCVTYGRPSTPQVAKSVCPSNPACVYELNRLVVVTKSENAASFLVSHSLKMLPPSLVIVSYADGAYGHVGYIYQATNFYYCGLVKAHDAEYIWNGHKYHPRVLHHMGISNPTAWAKMVGATKLPIVPKHRYVTATGSAMQKKQALKQVVWTMSRDYPKGLTSRYETLSLN
jgi:hypothetical protein